MVSNHFSTSDLTDIILGAVIKIAELMNTNNMSAQQLAAYLSQLSEADFEKAVDTAEYYHVSDLVNSRINGTSPDAFCLNEENIPCSKYNYLLSSGGKNTLIHIAPVSVNNVGGGIQLKLNAVEHDSALKYAADNGYGFRSVGVFCGNTVNSVTSGCANDFGVIGVEGALNSGLSGLVNITWSAYLSARSHGKRSTKIFNGGGNDSHNAFYIYPVTNTNMSFSPEDDYTEIVNKLISDILDYIK